jgi:hypothetical protein
MTHDWGRTTRPDASFVIAGIDTAETSAAAAAVALLGGTVAAYVPLSGLATALQGVADAPVVVVDVRGADDNLTHDTLVAVDAVVVARAWRLVVAMAVPQIDLVVAALAQGDAQLLCTPDQGEWIGALAVAGSRGAVPGRVREPEGEAERLARLNAEVTRIADVLARLTGDDAGGGRLADRRTFFAAAAPAPDVTAQSLRDIIRARRLRDRFFGEGLFEDPAWDMLLDLFAARLEGTRVSVSSLCIAAAVAPTTALRWIAKLTAAGLLRRSPDPSDGRRAFMELSDTAYEGLHRYVAALAEARLPLV